MLYKKILIAITILSFSLGSNFIRVPEFKGLDTKTAPDKIQQNRATDITNLDFNVMGSLQTRRGIEYLYTYPDNIRNINDRAVNNMIYENIIEYKGVIGSYNVSQYTNIGDDIYFFGADMVKWDNSLSLFAGLGAEPPGSLLGEVILTEDGKLNGTYNYAITYLYEDKESNPYYLRSETTENINLNNAFFAVGVTPDRFFMKYEGYKLYGYLNNNKKLLLNKYVYPSYLKYEDGYVLMAGTDEVFYKINPSTLKVDSQYLFSLSAEYPNYSVGSYSYISGVGVVYNTDYIASSTKFMDKDNAYIVVVLGRNYRGSYRPPGSSITYTNAYLTDVTIECFKITDYSIKTKVFSRFMGTQGDRYSYPIVGNIPSAYVESDVVYFLYGGSLYRSSDFANQDKRSLLISGTGSFHDYKLDGVRYLGKSVIFNWSDSLTIPVGNINYYTQMSVDGDTGYIMSNNVVDIYNIDMSAPTVNFVTSDSWAVTLDNTTLYALNQKISLTIPTLNSLANGVNIYRQWGGTGYFFLDNVIAGNTSYVDNISNLAQSVIPMETDNDAPPFAIDSEYIVARQFFLAPDGVVWYSKINKFESVPALNYIRIRSEADDSPVRIIEHFGGLLVFFQKSVWYIDLQSADPILWIPRKLNTDFGCPFPMTIVKGKLPNQQVGVFYMAEDRSVRVLTGVGSDGIQLFDNIYTDKVSLPVDDLFINDETAFNKVYFAFYDYKLYISLEDALLIWDAQFGGEWTKYELPIQQRYIGMVDGAFQMSSSKNMYVLGYRDYTEPNLIKNGTFLSTENWDIYTQGNTSVEAVANNMELKAIPDPIDGSFLAFTQYLGEYYGDEPLINNNNYIFSFSYDVPDGSVGYRLQNSIINLSGVVSGSGVETIEFTHMQQSSPEISRRLIVSFYNQSHLVTTNAYIGNVSLIASSNKEEIYIDNLRKQELLDGGTYASLENTTYVFSVSYNVSGNLAIRASGFSVPVEGSYFFNDVVTGSGIYSQTFTGFYPNFYLTITSTGDYSVSDTSLIRATDVTRDINWNYKTKVFGDSFEYYQDFDKIWLRGIQKATSDIRVDFTCNNDLGYYTDYILLNLYGDSIVNTGVNSLLGAGGRDIQLEFSGEDYVRLDAFSIKRTLREE